MKFYQATIFYNYRTEDEIQVVAGVLQISQTKSWNKFAVDKIYRHSYDG